MQVRLLILGAFIHGIFLLWTYDFFGKPVETDISCPLLPTYDTDTPRRLIFAVFRSPNKYGPINGIGKQFFRKISNVIYIGGSAIPQYYESSTYWCKFTYQENWDNFKGGFTFVFDAFRERVFNLTDKKYFFFLVFQGKNNKRNLLFILDQLEKERKFLDDHYGNNGTTVLFLSEEENVLNSFGNRVMKNENKLIRSADIIPLISTLFAADIPYHSFALVPANYFNTIVDLALAQYCNALNIIALTEDVRQSTIMLNYIQKLPLKNNLFTLKNAIEQMFLAKNYPGAMTLTQNIIASYTSSYVYAKQLVNTFIFIFIALTTICWIVLLCFEYIQTAAAILVTEPKRLIIHFIFLAISLLFVGVPLSQGWPYTYHFYFQIPILLLWLIITKLQSLFILKMELENLNQFLIFSFAILFGVEYLLIEEGIILSLSVCLFALLPSIKKFRTVPFIFIFIWYILSAILLGSIYLNLLNDIKPSTKYINFTGTIWLLLSGIALLWVQSKFDKILIAFLTVCIAATMWLQNVCLTLKNHCHILVYCTWPFIALIVLPVFSKTDAIRKLIHCVLSLIVPIMLTSTKLEPIALLILLAYVASWAGIETFNSRSNIDNLRRMFVLIYLLILTTQLTATENLSFRCFLCNASTINELYIFLLTLLRMTFIYASILTTFRIVLRSKQQAYCSAVLVAVVLAIASLRLLIPLAKFSFETSEFDQLLNRYIRINSMATVYIVSYTITMIYARNDKNDVTPSPPFEQGSI